MHIRESVELNYEDVLMLPKRSTLSSRSEVNLLREFKTPYGEIKLCPVLVANMYNTGSLFMGTEVNKYDLGIAYHKYIMQNCSVKNMIPKVVKNSFFTVGIGDLGLSYLAKYFNMTYEFNICIDVANGHQESFVDFVKTVRKLYPTAFIMAGNVVTGSMTEQLILAGANIVKVGIGPGSLCTTRLVTGCGRPQFSAVVECADAAHGLGGYVCADGGIKNVGDIAKAFGGNADFVMAGGLFMGCEENDGEWTTRYNSYKSSDEKCQLKCFGMSSEEAQVKFNGGVASYRTAEGECKYVDYKGPVSKVCEEIKGGLASACTYIGARSIKDMGKCAEFVRVNRIK